MQQVWMLRLLSFKHACIFARFYRKYCNIQSINRQERFLPTMFQQDTYKGISRNSISTSNFSAEEIMYSYQILWKL